ncbi:MAG: bifunctional 5,10-methylenetetrahydrofolate dehydrogenase/5,10-methenyltetrahydrofolate cyclohydrolase [Pseudomonadota bacterium]
MANTALLLDGKLVAQKIRNEIKEEVSAAKGNVTLATVLVGEDEASKIYVAMKQKQAEAAGIKSLHENLPQDITQKEIENYVKNLSENPDVNGILVQMPLPEHLNSEAVIEMIKPEKDVDGLTNNNLGKLITGNALLMPCTPLGVMRLIEHYKITTTGKTAVVVGRSKLVGMPQLLMLAKKGIDATASLAHSRTKNLEKLTGDADIIIAATGIPGMIKSNHVKPGAAVFDVGVTQTEKGIVGDVDFESVVTVAGAITPMPGGTGPMTVACLLENTLQAAKIQGVID